MQSTKIEAFDLADALLEDINAIDTNTEAIQENAADIDALETEMENVKKSVSDGKSLVAEAITTKGISTATDASFETMATNIINIPVLDTSDANATAGDILSGKSAYVNGLKVSGNIPSKAAATITPKASAQTIAAGQYLAGTQTIAGDANLVAGNIAKGKSIFGVNGTYDPMSSMTIDSGTALNGLSGLTFTYSASAYTASGSATITSPNKIKMVILYHPESSSRYYNDIWIIGCGIISNQSSSSEIFTVNTSNVYSIYSKTYSSTFSMTITDDTKLTIKFEGDNGIQSRYTVYKPPTVFIMS